MEQRLTRIVLILLCTAGTHVAVLGAEDAPDPASDPAVKTSPPTDNDLNTEIQALNHPLPVRRRQAVRQLANWGPLAFERLRAVTAGPDLEAALLARDLLDELGEVVLIGSQVVLEVDRHRIAWHEPIALTVRVVNSTTGPVRVPWPATSASAPAVQYDARQVGAMMDVADFLIVTGPDGQEVELRVDPIERDSAVYEAVHRRAGDNPPSHAVPAGTSDQVTVTRFNRGWARYPLLQRGVYAIELRYQPQWQDEAWTRQGFGLVVSNRVEVEVLDAAPELIREAGRPLKLVLTQQGPSLEAELVSTWDRDLWVNVNIGPQRETHARLEWQPMGPALEQPEPFEMESDATDPVFQADRLRRLAPGERLALMHAPAEGVLRRAQPGRQSDPAAVSATLRYTHLATPETLRAALRADRRHEGIPAELFTGSVSSEMILIESPPPK